MRMLWICIALAILAGAVAVYSGASISSVLIVGLLLLCCGGMFFGMGKRNGERHADSQHAEKPLRRQN